MKTTIIKTSIILAVIMITIASFVLHRPEVDAEEKIALQVITALQRSSYNEFSVLFPTLADFHELMVRNSELYGKNLSEASREFEKEFEYVLSPAFKNSFETILQEGAKAGIDWQSVKFVSVEVPEKIRHEFSVVPMTIIFNAQGNEHRLIIEKAFLLNGEWKISQYIALE
jgi:hypothetical protein